MEQDEYTGQLVGGPDDGNLITATVPTFRTTVTYRHELDGPAPAPVSVVIVRGRYRWDAESGVFRWELVR